jgi:hypothetical protein
MYSTCIFCNGSLGANEAIEAFPVGRRLAFDAAKGRLWVVCRGCERWNLTPMEERWEAIEQCERAFRDTKLRVSTDEIGLARLREGLELVRIGSPMRPEMAAWRYGDQFGRRRRRALVIGGASSVAAIAYAAAPMVGLMTIGVGGSLVLNILGNAYSTRRRNSVVASIPRASGASLIVPRHALHRTVLQWDARARSWSLDVAHRLPGDDHARWWRPAPVKKYSRTTLAGDEALVAARLLLPAINIAGASRRIVREAVDFLGAVATPESVFTLATRTLPTRSTQPLRHNAAVDLMALAPAVRLALEMAAHEESERRALEGELHLLEAAWQDAEEIAAIADDMFLPASVDEQLARLKRDR